MTAKALLYNLRGRGFRVRAVDGRIGITPAGRLNQHDRGRVERLRAEVLEHLAGEHRFEVPAGWTAASWHDRLIYLANTCEPNNPKRSTELREWAEGVKRYRMQPDPTPEQMEIASWIDDVARRECRRRTE